MQFPVSEVLIKLNLWCPTVFVLAILKFLCGIVKLIFGSDYCRALDGTAYP